MVDLFNEIIQARRIAVVARLVAGGELDEGEQGVIVSLLADLSVDLVDKLNQREQELKSLQ